MNLTNPGETIFVLVDTTDIVSNLIGEDLATMGAGIA
jgi:hypothetical protein